MTKYLVTTSIASIISWTAFILVIVSMDPYSSPGISLSLFFLSIFFALTGTFTLLGFYSRKYISKNEIIFRHINVSVRQAILLSIWTIGCLVFLIFGVLTWWDGAILLAIIMLMEFYFSSQE